MTCDLVALRLVARDPRRLARFWATVLDREPAGDGVVLPPGDDVGFALRFVATAEPKVALDRMHLDLTSTSLEDQQRRVSLALTLGARHLDVGQRPEEDHVVLADPEDNEFCVVGPGNSFLAGCGPVGALSCDGSPQVGAFWSAALGWPLVWEQDQETAIQAPRGGPKIAWGGLSESPPSGRDRLSLDVAPPPGGDQLAEVERLLSLGATSRDLPRASAGAVVLEDPDGNRFRVLPPG